MDISNKDILFNDPKNDEPEEKRQSLKKLKPAAKKDVVELDEDTFEKLKLRFDN